MPEARTAVYTGSFDPLSLGHMNVIQRSSRLFDQVIVGIGINVEKRALFTPDERVALVRQCVQDLPNVRIQTFSGLAVEFVRKCGSRIMIRGIRPLTDISGEITMLLANRELDPEIETVFLMADQLYAHVSSTLIKQIAPLANDDRLARFVPASIVQPLRERLAELSPE
ncbi:MAG: pantetheine-phosphate adenylyltransferase [Planctomycetota bacterium]|nr:pantetheine-phosphate adenylyltransferase [Planctomycetota bacterium]